MFKGYGQRTYEHCVCFTSMPPTFGYTGHRFDRELNHYYAKFRYYNPTTMRWLSRGPLGMVDGPNVYAYVRGSVVHTVDPRGLYSWTPSGRCVDDSMTDNLRNLLACIEKNLGHEVRLTCARRPSDRGSPHEHGEAIDIGTNQDGDVDACELKKATTKCASELNLTGLRVCQGKKDGQVHIDLLDRTKNPRTGRTRSSDCSTWGGTYKDPCKCE